MSALSSTEIPRLGPARYDSPFFARLGERAERYFHDETRRMLFDDELPLVGSGEQTTLELAGPRRRIYFEPQRASAAILCSGGLCPGLNDVIHGLVQVLRGRYGLRRVLGIRYGYDGLQRGVPPIALYEAQLSRVHEQGGCFLGTARCKLDIEACVARLIAEEVDLLFAIGGDGSMRGAIAIADELARRGRALSVVGVPKTIDNDLQVIDQSFGFDTAFSTAMRVIRSAHAEAFSAPRGVGLVKLMGRHSGFIACWATLASSDVSFCLIPEVRFSLGREGERGLLPALMRRLEEKDHAVVVVAEGAGQEHFDPAALGRDPSGNQKLGDIGRFLAREIEEHFTRRGEPVVLKYIDPSYILRSVPANATDSAYCLRLAQHAAHGAMAGLTRFVVGQRHGRFVYLPMELVVKGRRQVDPDGDLWLSVLESTGQPSLV
ncbi:MAG: ATP-dependent 6-phosphofructokinase [Planctomycetes bacterium]|nr:ATP-dependent 6-phosphofructokinase [Planctomycetota bacterium]